MPLETLAPMVGSGWIEAEENEGKPRSKRRGGNLANQFGGPFPVFPSPTVRKEDAEQRFALFRPAATRLGRACRGSKKPGLF